MNDRKLFIEFHKINYNKTRNINFENLAWIYDINTRVVIFKKYIEADLKVGMIYDFTYGDESDLDDDSDTYTYVVVKKENNIYYLAEYYCNKFYKLQEKYLGEGWIKCDVEKEFGVDLKNFVVEATEEILEGVEISSYNKGRVEGIKDFVKELKQHSCFYDPINYMSFEAVNIEVIDEIAESIIKKIRGETND